MSEIQKEINEDRKKKLKKLRKEMGIYEFIKLLQSYSEGTGDYTKEKCKIRENFTIEDFKKYMEEHK